MNNQIGTLKIKLISFKYISILTICWLLICTLKVSCQDQNVSINSVNLIKEEKLIKPKINQEDPQVNKDNGQNQKIILKFDNLAKKNMREFINSHQQTTPSKIPETSDRQSPKTDSILYNTGISESVVEIKYISLSTSLSGSSSNAKNSAESVRNVVFISSPANTKATKNINVVEKTRDTAQPELISDEVRIHKAEVVLPLFIPDSKEFQNNPLTVTPSAPANPNLRAPTDGNTNIPTITHVLNLEYEDYLTKFKPNQLNNPSEVSVYRQAIFNTNVATINQHNAQVTTQPNNYTKGVNSYLDFTEEEFNRMQFKLIIPDELKKQAQAGRAKAIAEGQLGQTDPPKIYIDWRCQASAVISQGACGATYTIAALEAIQINTRIYGSRAAYLSIQQVISCSKPSLYLNGCQGGYFKGTYDYVQQNGVGQNSVYYYDQTAKMYGQTTDCNRDIIEGAMYKRTKVYIRGSKTIRMGDCEQLINQLKFRTIAVAIAAYGFQFYTSGTFTTSNKNINHGVTLVGYHPVKGYLIKNSWGITWGSQGYGYIDATTGICDYAMYPILMSETETPPPQPSAPCNSNFNTPFQD